VAAPTTSAEFDRAYRAPITFWGDVRVPSEVKELARNRAGQRALELGCGVGRLSRYMAQQGLRVTGADFSAAAIEQARIRVAADDQQPEFCVGDVTRLEALIGPYDISLDVGCFHCLNEQGQRSYVTELSRLLKSSRIHLLWVMDKAPSDMPMSPASIRDVFAPAFVVLQAHPSRRRFVRSHWYWLIRS
jgi:cyclopropane fatty-acyl-phospholipid synthase-like methyltransferase